MLCSLLLSLNADHRIQMNGYINSLLHIYTSSIHLIFFFSSFNRAAFFLILCPELILGIS